MKTIVPGVRAWALFVAFSLFSLFAKSQSISTGNGKFEVGIGLGPMFFLGDLGGNYGKGKTFLKDVNLPLTKLSKGLFANFYPTEWIGVRVAVNHSNVEGYDSVIRSKGSHEESRKLRNLQFKSSIFEAYTALEIYPTVFLEQYDELNGKLRPYGLIGIGMFRFNPKGEYIAPNGTRTWVDLQPLRLEGQGMMEYPDRKPYKLTQMHVPIGFGAKYYFGGNKYIGMEILHRTTFTDYIDDVSTNYIDANLFRNYLTPAQATMARQMHFRENLTSAATRGSTPSLNEQRGNPKQNDAFFSSTVRFGWRLADPNSPASRASRMMRCPTFY
ncbi:hypothetical protein [Pseudocnuella soli]|uniref:hypothetical protein n=1 Tax=Pseudocnuella soli TaxID=2502779 RepID=UPI0010530253|nr:hypothetical protein [Pseudocnuella soli]